MTYVSVNTHQGKGTKTKDTPSSDKGYSHLSPGSSTINLTDFSELHDDVRMIYSAQTYKDPDSEMKKSMTIILTQNSFPGTWLILHYCSNFSRRICKYS
jgi:hypothetical protein